MERDVGQEARLNVVKRVSSGYTRNSIRYKSYYYLFYTLPDIRARLILFLHILVCKTDCVFPFIYKSVTYHSCTRKDSGSDWCYTKVDSNGVGVSGKWGYCQSC